MKKVLVITYYWPPMGGGGVQRWMKTTKYLRDYNWEPVIFTTENAEISIHDESLLAEVPEGVEVIKVPIWEPFGLYKKLMGKKKDEKINPGFLQESKGNSTLQKFSVWVRGNFFIPDAKMFWIKPSVKHLMEYLKHNQIDAIVSTGPPHTTHIIAKKVAKKFNIPWLADFRDPWTNIDFYDQLMLSDWADRKHKRMEKEVLLKADEVVTVSWSWAEDFKRISGRTIKVITNGFDPADFRNAGQVDLDEKFTITHAGSLNKDRNPYILWEVLGEMVKNDGSLNKSLQIKLIGPVDVSVMNEIEKHGLTDQLLRVPSLPHNEVVKHLVTSQTLLLPLNDVPYIDGVIPGKLYEYIGSKRPIICIGKPTGDSAKIIKETDAGIVADFKDKETLKQGLSSYFEAYKKQSLHINSKGFDKYSRKVLAGELAEQFNRITQQSR